MIRQTQLRIRYYGDPVLRRRAGAIKSFTEKDKAMLDEMNELMHLSGGIGLAAPQVGICRQIIVIDIGQGLVTLLNPSVVKRSGSDTKEEGCLSLPGIYVKVKRAKKVTVEALNEKRELITISAEGLFARVLQHEIDHLKGRLILDYANIIQRISLKKKLNSFCRSQKNGLSQ